jgi:predicted phage terminase large subunit-like protein
MKHASTSQFLNGIPAEMARRSFRCFIHEGWAQVEPSRAFLNNWHVDAIAHHLQAISEGHIHHLLITVPPGHAKSLIVTVLWPAWQWARQDQEARKGPDGPGARGIYTSYDGDLAIRDSVRCRALLNSEWYQRTFRPRWNFVSDQNLKNWFENDRKGFRIALGVNKGTGYRGDLVVCDDPLNAKQQNSPAALANAIFWWDQVMSSRVNDHANGAFVIIMQRLNEGDLAGHVIRDASPHKYEHLNLPSLFEPERRCRTSVLNPNTNLPWEDPRTEEGELLFPGLFPQQVIDNLKTQLGSQGFAAQHQQRPSPAEGGIFKRRWWPFWVPKGSNLPRVTFRDENGIEQEAITVVLPEQLDEGIQSWDCAFKDRKEHDYVAGQVWGRLGADIFLLDQVHKRLDFPGTLQAVRNLSAKWPQVQLKLIEDKANGTAVIQSLQHEIPGIIAVNPIGGKIARAQAVTPRIEAGNVYLPHPAFRPWVTDFVEECAAFPNGRNDDCVDAMTQGLARLNLMPLIPAPQPESDEEEPGYWI